MKPLLLLSVLFITACATQSPKGAIVKIIPAPTSHSLKRSESRGVRHPEIIKGYPLGRYVDPGRGKIMHEAHTIYRVESTSKWNLAKPRSTSSTTASQVPSNELSRNELLVELNRQKEATKAVMQSGRTVSGKLSELTSALQENRSLSEQNAGIRQELEATRARVEALERQSREQPLSGPETKPKSGDDPW